MVRWLDKFLSRSKKRMRVYFFSTLKPLLIQPSMPSSRLYTLFFASLSPVPYPSRVRDSAARMERKPPAQYTTTSRGSSWGMNLPMSRSRMPRGSGIAPGMVPVLSISLRSRTSTTCGVEEAAREVCRSLGVMWWMFLLVASISRTSAGNDFWAREDYREVERMDNGVSVHIRDLVFAKSSPEL